MAGIPERITIDWLWMWGACAAQIERFGRTFGDGADLTPANITAAGEARLDIDWLARRVLVPSARAEYRRVTATAWAEYERVTATAWAEYRRVTATAWAEYERVTAPAWAEYERATAPARDEYERATAVALAEYQRAAASALIGVLWPDRGD